MCSLCWPEKLGCGGKQSGFTRAPLQQLVHFLEVQGLFPAYISIAMLSINVPQSILKH